MSPLRIVSTGLIAMMGSAQTLAADENPGGPPNPLFADNEILEISITLPVSELMADRPVDDDSPGRLTYRDAALGEVALDIGIRTRGRFRQQRRVCPFAPLRLNFRKKDTRNTLFRQTNKVKLVTHCRDGSPRHSQGVLREYLAYRIFNTMTDRSFRVRLLKVTYFDTELDGQGTVNYGFFIEPVEQLAERLGMQLLDVDRTYVRDLDGAHTNLGSVFQYLIGNTDFSPIRGAQNEPCCHNYALVAAKDGPQLAIPYDLDMSGLVSAPYAKPNPRFKLRSVRSRLYRGRCANNAYLDATLQAYRDRRQDLYGLLDEIAPLDEMTRKSVLRYINEFYATIDSPRRLETRIRERCI